MFEVTCIDKYGNTVTNLTQWDLNQTLYIEEHVFTTAPQFHFCNKNSKKALVVQSELKDGILEIDVPNILLTEPYTITMYLYLTEGDSSKTVEFVQIPVRQRPQPDSFEYEDNVVVIDVQELANEIRALNDSISSAEEGRVNAENIRESNESNRQAQEEERQANVTTAIQDVENAIANINVFEEEIESAEAIRQSQEEIRQSQESDRQTNTATAIQNANNATDRANLAAETCEGIISGTGLISSSEKGIANGVATLDSNALIPIEQLPNVFADIEHTHSPSEVGLENVPNVATNDQTVTYTVATSNTEMASGEKMSTAFGKIAKAIKSFISHLADTTSHVTSSEKDTWNGKANASHGNHVPDTQTASNKVFLRNDNTWQTVTPANIGASETGHKHTKSEITDFPSTMTPSAHNQAASTISAGTLGGKVQANATAMATLTNAQVRDIVIKDSVTEGGSATESNGIIVFTKG